MPFTAQAQWYGGSSARPAPLYPYELQGRYVIHRPASHEYPYVRYFAGWHHVRPRHVAKHHVSRHGRKRIVINTKKSMREKPVVIEHRRVVDNPPRMIERRHYVEGVPLPPLKQRALPRPSANIRVIHAEAEITILGPDRMSIRLYRKRGEADRAFDKK